MKKLCMLLVVSFLFPKAILGYFIVAEEKGSIFYSANGELTESTPRNKTYYEVDEVNGIITRTKVIILKDDKFGKRGDVIPDGTQYHIILAANTQDVAGSEKIIHAVGRPGSSAFELLTIGKDTVMASKSTGKYVVVFNMKIIERSDVP